MCTPLIVAIIHRTEAVVMNRLFNNKTYLDIMKKCSAYSDYDGKISKYSLKYVTFNVKYDTLFHGEGKSLYCIFKLKSEKGAYIGGRMIYEVDSINCELVRLNDIKEYDEHYRAFPNKTMYDGHGWWRYVYKNDKTGYLTSPWIYVGNDEYRYAKKIFRNELVIFRDKQRDIDFMKRLDFLLEKK
jgi:hypothetical protein